MLLKSKNGNQRGDYNNYKCHAAKVKLYGNFNKKASFSKVAPPIG